MASTMTQPTENTTDDGWERCWWPQHDVHAPSTIDACPLCGALVSEWSGRDLHIAWHRSRGEAPPA